MKLLLLALAIPIVVGLGGSRRQDGRRVVAAGAAPGRRGQRVGMPGGYFPKDMGLLNDEERNMINTAAAKAIELMNDVKTEGGVSNAMPLKYTDILSAATQVVAGTNYDLELKVLLDGQTVVCHVRVSNLYPWMNGGTWSVSTMSSDDPCAPYIPADKPARKRRSARLLGGESEANKDDAMVQEAAKWALEKINEMSNSLFRQSLLKITHVTRQVINGYRYHFLLAVVSSSCPNNEENKHKTLENCPANDDPKPQDCDVSVIYSQGKYSMENFKCKARKGVIGGDDHDYKPHGNIIGGDDHDYKPHGSIIGGDDHDYKPHGNIIGGDDHDYKPHGSIIGGDDHDYKPHGNIIGGDDHDYKPHGNLIGGDDHDYKPHGNIIGGDDHDYKPHGNNGKRILGQDGHDYMPHGSGNVQHMSILGGGTHDYLPHGKCSEHLAEFSTFKSKYNRLYASPQEEAERFQVFCDNMELVKKIQAAEQGSAVYGATKFADLTQEEFRKKYLGLKPTKTGEHVPMAKIPTDPIPDSWDWRDHNAVTPVKNQGFCGSCWAFSTTGNIEGQYAIKSQSHKLYSLSEQELIDCDKIDQGCGGGFMYDAYEALKELGGIETEDDYQYKAKDQKCQFNRSEVVVKVTGSVNISQDEGEMAAWLYKNGPIAIGINSFPMQFYFWGIAHPWKFFCDPNALDHGVLIVGYGKKGSEPYWIIKNSWGEDWGRSGYYYIYRGDGSCGLNRMCSSAIVE